MNIHMYGNFKGPTVFFLAGWPDTCDVFRDNLMAALQDDYRIVGLTLPGFDRGASFVECYHEHYERGKRLNKQRRRQRSEQRRRWQNAAADGAAPPHLSSESADLANLVADDMTAEPGVAKLLLQKFTALSGFDRISVFVRETLTRRSPDGISDFVEEDLQEYTTLGTPCTGYSMADLVNLLEVAVDTALDTHNFAPQAYLASDTVGTRNAKVEGVPAHQVPAYLSKPAFIAHGFGCTLLYELLLNRPQTFSRVVVLDVGASLFGTRLSNPALMTQEERYREDLLRRTGVYSAGWSTLPACPSTSRSFSDIARSSSSADDSAAWSRCQQEDKHAEKPEAGAGRRERKKHRSSLGAGDGAERLSGAERDVRKDLQSSQCSDGGCADRARRGPSASAAAVGAPHHNESLCGNATEADDDEEATHRRRLASQYAIPRRRYGRFVYSKLYRCIKRLTLLVCQVYIIVCSFFLPWCLAERLLALFVSTFTDRPRYVFDPNLTVDDETENFNQKVYQDYYYDTRYGNVGSGGAATLTADDLIERSPTAGWHVVLLPAVDRHTSSTNHNGTVTGDGDDAVVIKKGYCPGSTGFVGSHRLVEDGSMNPYHAFKDARGPAYLSSNGRSSVAVAEWTGQSFSCRDSVTRGHPPESLSAPHIRDHERKGVPPPPTPSAAAAAFAIPQGTTLPTPYMSTLGFDEVVGAPPRETRGTQPYRYEQTPVSYKSYFFPPTPRTNAGFSFSGVSSPQSVTGIDFAASTYNTGRDTFIGGELSARFSADGDVLGGSPFDRGVTAAFLSNEDGRQNGYASASDDERRNLDGTAGSVRDVSDGAAAVKRHHQKQTSDPNWCGGSRRNWARAPDVDAAQLGWRTVSAAPTMGWLYLRYLVGLFLGFIFTTRSPWSSPREAERLLMRVVRRRIELEEELTEQRRLARQRGGVGAGPRIAWQTTDSANSKDEPDTVSLSWHEVFRRDPALAAEWRLALLNGGAQAFAAVDAGGCSPLVTQRFFLPINVPVLFLYGDRTYLNFFSHQWLDYITQHKRPEDGISKAIKIHGGGHWFFADPKFRDKVARHVSLFLTAEVV